jgi:hypothetical protein
MAGQAPWQKKKGKSEKTETAAAAVAPVPVVVPAPTTHVAAAAASLASLYEDVSFASITELPDHEVACALPLPFSVILDSGTTVTLVKDRSLFHTYSTEDPISVKTANHGILQTNGRGTCVAWLRIGGQRMRLRMSNCLHAPDALLNLISVSCMNQKGWDVNFLKWREASGCSHCVHIVGVMCI